MRQFQGLFLAFCAVASSACVAYDEPGEEIGSATQALSKGQYLLTQGSDGKELALTDPAGVVTSLSTSSKPTGMALAPGRSQGVVQVLVTDASLDLSAVTINLATGKKGSAVVASTGLLDNLAPPGSGQLRGHFTPTDLVVDAERNLAYVPGLTSTAVVDLSGKLEVSHIFDLSAGSADTSSFLSGTFRGIGPASGVVTDTGDVFITNLVTSNVSWMRNGTLQTPIPVGELPMGIAADDQYVFVTSLLSGELHVVAQDSGKLVTTIPVGAGPWGVATDRQRDLVYVANFLSGDISVIDTTTLMPTHYSPLPATNLGTLMADLGVSSAELQDMFNQFAVGGGLDGPLKRFLAGSATGGLDGLVTTFSNRFVRSLGLRGRGGKNPYPVIRTVKVEGDNVYVLDTAHRTLMVLDASKFDDAGDSTGKTVANVGPSLVVFKPCSDNCDESDAPTKSAAPSPSVYTKGDATVARSLK